jgi:hypothetical protein
MKKVETIVREKINYERGILNNQLSNHIERVARVQVWNTRGKQMWERIGNGVMYELETEILDQEWEHLRQNLEL